jgi:hypothetical protein
MPGFESNRIRRMRMTTISLVTHRREPKDRGYAWAAFGVYIAALVVPFGAHGFYMGWAALRECATDSGGRRVGYFLLGLSWLANPVVWAGIILLGIGLRWWAAVAGVIALLFAVCAVGEGLISPGYYLWLVCMSLVVYPALRAPTLAARTHDAADAGPAKQEYSTRRKLLCLALVVPPVIGIVLVTLKARGAYTTFWFDDPDPFSSVYTGEDARLKIVEKAGATRHRDQQRTGLPASAKDFWFYESGFLGKHGEYWTFTCGSRDDCVKAVEYFGGRLADFKPWQPSKYAVVMEGPTFRGKSPPSPKVRGNPWGVRGIKNGIGYERVELGGRLDRIEYFAIDFDINRVFFYNDNSFDTDDYHPDDETQERNAKLSD